MIRINVYKNYAKSRDRFFWSVLEVRLLGILIFKRTSEYERKEDYKLRNDRRWWHWFGKKNDNPNSVAELKTQIATLQADIREIGTKGFSVELKKKYPFTSS
ncbi:MAG: hypothetical protein ACOVQA_04780 [Thermoflexibacteraceae bacterium]|jgi:hypothetical protein